VWKAYADVKTALRKHEYALALLTASERPTRRRWSPIARRAGDGARISSQRSAISPRPHHRIQSRAELLTTSAALTFAAGD